MKRGLYNRRQFLSRTAAVATAGMAAPLIVPATALGRGMLAAPSERVTIVKISSLPLPVRIQDGSTPST